MEQKTKVAEIPAFSKPTDTCKSFGISRNYLMKIAKQTDAIHKLSPHVVMIDNNRILQYINEH